MANIVFNSAIRDLFNGDIDFNADTFKLALFGSTYRAIADETKRDSHAVRSDLSDEITGSGYSSGGITLGSVTVTMDTATNEVYVDLADPTFSSVTLSGVQYGVLYKSTGVAANDRLVLGIDIYALNSNASVSVTNGNLVLQVPATGLFYGKPDTGS